MADELADDNRTVVLETDWQQDGHEIAWDPEGCFLVHPDTCLWQDHGNERKFLCSPGEHENTFGISIADLGYEAWEKLDAIQQGSREIEWKLIEVAHPDLDATAHLNLAATGFSIRLVEDA